MAIIVSLRLDYTLAISISQDRKDIFKRCWEAFLEANDFPVEDVKLIRVTPVAPKGPTRQVISEVWVTFSATAVAVRIITMEGYLVHHPSKSDKKVMAKVSSNIRAEEAAPLKDLSTETIEGLYQHRG